MTVSKTVRRLAVLVVLAMLVGGSSASAQYFGRNKVQYRTFTFEVLKTEHFDLYFYPEEAKAAEIVGRMAERWNSRLSRFFGHELRGRQSVILYAVSAHFRQTNAVEGLIGEGTGGVTEALKRRIVLPMSGSLADTDHVLGHELVHAFQFDITGDDPRESMATAPDILQYPLWFVEGMAEYLSLGPVDAQTAMWLRDAAVREKLPHIKDLDNPEYFPYRWGHAFWAYIGAKYGDRTVASLIRSAANPRVDLGGMTRQLGTDPDTLTAEWHTAIRTSATAVAAEMPPFTSEATLVVDRSSGGGRYNLGPRVSPDGTQIAFFSERGRFSVELYIADAETGRIKKRLSQSASDPHFDSLEFLNSAGAWSPDGTTLAIAATRGGRPVLALFDPKSGHLRREVELADLDDALHPGYAPDGRSLVFSGNRGGLIDLYRVTLATGRIERLTDDPFADLEPTFTPDGRGVVFVTERYSTNLDTLEPGALRLAYLDVGAREVRPISAFLRGKHLSPQVSADGRSVTFIADPDGVSNLYRVPIDGGPILQLSSYLTGVAGITSSSPALSIATATGRLSYSVFEDDGHSIYVLDPSKVVALVPPEASTRAALLPGRTTPGGDVQRLLTDHARGLPAASAQPDTEPYSQSLALDAIGQPTISAGISSYGGYAGGSISAFFSDMLGDRTLGVGAEIAGTFADFGGYLTYVSRRHRWNWAVGIEQFPYRIRYLDVTQNGPAGTVAVTETTQRQTNRGMYGVAAYPFNTATRLEFSGGLRALSFTQDTVVRRYEAGSGDFIDRQTATSRVAAPMQLFESSVALVRDASFFGATGPILGSRSRLELARNDGSLAYSAVLVDLRRYWMPKKPVTVGVRVVHMGRYGQDGEHPQLVRFFLGQQDFVHGYGYGSFDATECPINTPIPNCAVYGNLSGSRLLVGNFELRAPLVGLLKGELEYGRLPMDVSFFVDAGVSWSRDTLPSFAGGSRQVVRSVGGAARFNAFGLLIIEAAVSRPLDRLNKGIQFQIGLRQGF